MGQTNKTYFKKYRKSKVKKYRKSKVKKRYNKISKKRYNRKSKHRTINNSRKMKSKSLRYHKKGGGGNIGLPESKLHSLHNIIDYEKTQRDYNRDKLEIRTEEEMEQKKREQKKKVREYKFSKTNNERTELKSRIINILDTNNIKQEAEEKTKLLPIPMELSIKCEKRECESDKLCRPWRGAPDDLPKLICGLPNMNKEPIYSYTKEILPKYNSTIKAIKNIDWKKNYRFQKEIIKYIDEFYNIKGETYDNLISKINNLIMSDNQ